MKYLFIILLFSSCTWHNYWHTKCGGYIGTHKVLKEPRYYNLDKPFTVIEDGVGDSLIFTNYNGCINQHFYIADTLGDWKAAHTKITITCCK